MARQRLLLFLIITVVFLGGAFLVYGQRSGSLTIFGDATHLAGTVVVADAVDLEKGVVAGNGNLTVVNDGLELASDATENGTCQFDIGNPEVTQFQRFQSIKNDAQPDGTRITMQFAGSLDGIRFESLSNPITLSPLPDNTDVMDLSTLVPAGSHFLRIVCTLESETPSATPRLDGFQIDYEVLGDIATAGPLDISADSAATLSSATDVSVNGTLAGTNDTDLGNSDRRQATTNLAGTGVNFWVIVLVILWLAATVAIFRQDTDLPKQQR